MTRHANGPAGSGGASRDRTDDPLLAKQVLSQLSYGPRNPGRTVSTDGCCGTKPELVGLGGFEPPTSPLSGVRSNQLSYRPGMIVDDRTWADVVQFYCR